MIDIDNFIRALAKAAPDAPVRLRRGSIVSTQTNGTATITVAGGSQQVSGVKVASSVCPIPGTAVWIASDGRDMFVIAALSPSGPAFAQVSREATQSTTSGSYATLSFDTVQHDPYGMYAAGSPTKLTIPVTGVYSIAANIAFASNATGDRILRIDVNGSGIASHRIAARSGGMTEIRTAWIDRLVVGDYVELKAWQDSGGALNIDSQSTRNRLSIAWLGPSAS